MSEQPGAIPRLEKISGTVHYAHPTASITEQNGLSSLLVFDVPPAGHFQSRDIAAAYNHLRKVEDLTEDDALTVTGIRAHFGTRPVVLIVRIP